MVMEVRFEQVCVGGENFDDSLGEPLHVPLPNLRVLTLQLLENLKTLGQLSENIHHGVREIRVFGVLLELQQ